MADALSWESSPDDEAPSRWLPGAACAPIEIVTCVACWLKGRWCPAQAAGRHITGSDVKLTLILGLRRACHDDVGACCKQAELKRSSQSTGNFIAWRSNRSW